MTVSSAPYRAATRDTRVGPIQRAGLIAIVVLGPLSVTVLSAIVPYHSADDSTTITTKVANHPAAQSLVLWLSLIAMLTLVPAVITVGLLAARRARLLANWGMALALAGFSLLFASTATDFTALAAAEAGIALDATTRLLDELSTNPAQTVAVVGFVVGHIVGMVLLGVALLRARAVPVWAAWVLTTLAFATVATTLGRRVWSHQ